MYPWVTHMHTHLAGECPHRCKYCYVQRNPHGVHPRWKGKLRLIEEELKINYGLGKTIFIEHMSDLFSEWTFPNWIQAILSHCRRYPDNIYVIQTKCPTRILNYLTFFPKKFIVGTTIESNRPYSETRADPPIARYRGMKELKKLAIETFVTIEPIMDFDLEVLIKWLKNIKPAFVNIGADSKRSNLPEPPAEKVKELIGELRKITEVKIKSNLNRILKGS